MTPIAEAYYVTAQKEWRSFRTGEIVGGGVVVPPVTGTLIGCSELKFGELDALLRNPTGSKAGGTNTGFSARRTYDGSMPSTFAGSKMAGDVALGVASCWSHTPAQGTSSDPDQVAAGNQDTQWQAIFNGWPAGHSGFVTYGHEPENNSYNLANFRAAQARIFDIYMASSCDKTKVKVGPILTGDGYRSGQYTTLLAPPNKMSFVGIDFYEYQRFPPDQPDANLGMGAAHPPSYYCGPAVDFASANKLPFLIGEYANHPNRADILARTRRFQAQLDFYQNQPYGCLGFMIYHSMLQPLHGPWWWDAFPNYADINDKSDSDPTTVETLRNVLSTSPRYVEG